MGNEQTRTKLVQPVIRKTERGYLLEARTWLPQSMDEVFAFFADANNLDAITPPWLRFRILTPMPIEMREGLLLDYALRIRMLPMKWRSEITVWDPPHRFVDEQRKGPYRWWRHEHLFDESDRGTDVIDRVDYAVRGGGLVHRVFVGPDLLKIFRFRTIRLEELFGRQGTESPPRPTPSRA